MSDADASPAAGAAVVGDDGLGRCPWGAVGPAFMTAYHDDEWGRVVRGEQALFERLCLEGFQAGLSWRTILAKRENFRAAFAGFDPDAVAAFTDADLDERLGDAGIIRSRAKIAMVRHNAVATIALRDQPGGLDGFLWSRRPAPLDPAPRRASEVPTSSDHSAALAKDLKRAGFRFIGPTSAYALMEATGMIDTHLVGCHRRGRNGDRDGENALGPVTD